ncbi:MAG: DUF6455 family protein [Reyranella sp.]|uniref:DUF6455 family protein n=1 Tax=Reyranella sp. TaxID=1929291 RepID=UPI003D0B71E3
MTTLQELQQTISRFVKGGRKRRQLKRELAQLAAMGELDAVLADVGLVRSQVQPLIAGSADPNERLDKMLDRLGIDVARLPVESLRDMAWACMNCRTKRHCRQWLSDNKGPDFHSFCPNAAEFDNALWRQHPELASSRASPAGCDPRELTFYPRTDELRRMQADARRREVRVLLDSAM